MAVTVAVARKDFTAIATAIATATYAITIILSQQQCPLADPPFVQTGSLRNKDLATQLALVRKG